MPRSRAAGLARKRRDPSPFDHYVRGLETSTKNNTMAYGYSVAITAAFAALFHFHPGPSILDILLFAVGASLAFAVINAAITRGYRSRFPDEPELVVALGTSFSVFSVTLAAGCAALLGWVLGAWVVWLLAPFVATVVYVLAVGAEMAIAGEAHEEGGIEDDGERDAA